MVILISMGTMVMELDLIEKQVSHFQNVIIFGVDMSSSVHVENKKKDILILGSGPKK